MSSAKPDRTRSLGERAKAVSLRAYLWVLLHLPFAWRRALAAWLGAGLPMRRSRIGRTIQAQIAVLLPERGAQSEALAAEVLANMARAQIELLSGPAFAEIAGRAPVGGPGWLALQAAHRDRRPAILLVSHFGNPAAVGAALMARGIVFASLYKPQPVPQIEGIYHHAVQNFTRPMFPTGRAGVGAMVRHLRGGGMVSISFDLDRPDGAVLDFLGRPSRTPLSMAEMALRYDAALIPVYGLRRSDGAGFTVVIDLPIPAGPPAAMMQAANASLERMVRAHPDQWLWWHRRWKPTRADQPD